MNWEVLPLEVEIKPVCPPTLSNTPDSGQLSVFAK